MASCMLSSLLWPTAPYLPLSVAKHICLSWQPYPSPRLSASQGNKIAFHGINSSCMVNICGSHGNHIYLPRQPYSSFTVNKLAFKTNIIAFYGVGPPNGKNRFLWHISVFYGNHIRLPRQSNRLWRHKSPSMAHFCLSRHMFASYATFPLLMLENA